ncbi:hypothetical protein VPH209E381_0085 [Vibrio phage 209E38-1]
MIEYVKQKLEQGYYIAEHGRFESSTGRRGSIIGGYSLMSKEGFVDYDISYRTFKAAKEQMGLVGLEWGNSQGVAGGTEYRTKHWHEVEIND